MAEINKKTLEHLADLARIELTDQEEKKLLADLEKILNHFKELQELDTEGVESMSGGTQFKNVFREDAPIEDKGTKGRETKNIVDAFPEIEKGYLKIPPVFEE
jgi:aspartyl-tRNA(Asn)/glutamyl-tRNA(Gln) amidotransferase subunit C